MSEMSDQKRVIIASVLSFVVIVVWWVIFPTPTPKPSSNAAPGAGATSAVSTQGTAGTSGAGSAAATSPAGRPTPAVVEAAAPPPIGDTAEKTYVVENDLYRVVLSNRGAVVRSWELKKYTDASEPPKQLDLVHAAADVGTTNWPFTLQIADAQVEGDVNQALYAVKPSAEPSNGVFTAPVELEFHWSDGNVDVVKRLKFGDSYVVQVETSVDRNGQPVAHRVAWRGGFGDFAVPPAQRVMNAFTDLSGSIRTLAPKNLGEPNQRTAPAEVPGQFEAVGIEDRYFAAAFMPPAATPGQPPPAIATLAGRQLVRNEIVDGKAQQETLPEIAAGTTTSGPTTMRVFVGPKDLDTLKAINPPLDGLVQFGWFGFIAAPLFYVLRWLHGYIPNYGWAIVVMTLAINTLLYPLTRRSWRQMQGMQKVAPEIRSIQDRYKKYSMKDPRKQEMNKEMMAIYAREGINPLGSCIPMLAQFPIWYGIERMLTATMELRHAPWFGWIKDLSAKDPYYILPVLMAVLMYVQQKMTPQTVTDPQQQRMMNMMPLMMGAMFIFLPLSSGLVLYILTSNVVGVAQRWHLNRTSPVKAPSARRAATKSPAT
jgi:YidC/Oxa1 family membrane protein insertase